MQVKLLTIFHFYFDKWKNLKQTHSDKFLSLKKHNHENVHVSSISNAL